MISAGKVGGEVRGHEYEAGSPHSTHSLHVVFFKMFLLFPFLSVITFINYTKLNVIVTFTCRENGF